MGQLTIVSTTYRRRFDAGPSAKLVRRLGAPQLAGRAVKVVAIQGVNPVVILGEPADEIAVAWRHFSSLDIVWPPVNVLILAIFTVSCPHCAIPRVHLEGYSSLEDGHYSTRLKLPKVREFAVITERFNMLAGALDTAREENSRLYRQLITVQGEERRAIARIAR